MKSALHGLIRVLETTKERKNQGAERNVNRNFLNQNSKRKNNGKKQNKTEKNIQELWEKFKRCKICVIAT